MVLLVDQETLIFRDSLRPKEFQMGERSIILLQEFKQSSLDNKHVIETSKNEMNQLETIINEIRTNPKYIVVS